MGWVKNTDGELHLDQVGHGRCWITQVDTTAAWTELLQTAVVGAQRPTTVSCLTHLVESGLDCNHHRTQSGAPRALALPLHL